MSRTKVQRKSTYNARRRSTERLTPKQLQILKWSAKGYTKNEMCGRVGMTVHGVDWYVRKILLKLRAKTMTHAVYNAFQQGLLG